MVHLLPIWWVAWWLGATLLALALILLNLRRRRPLALASRRMAIILPTLREDLAWGALVVGVGAVTQGLVLWLMNGGHTARALLVVAFCGLLMLLGLVMLLRNGLAPTDTIWRDPGEIEEAEKGELSFEEYNDVNPLEISQKHLSIRTGSGGLGSGGLG